MVIVYVELDLCIPVLMTLLADSSQAKVCMCRWLYNLIADVQTLLLSEQAVVGVEDGWAAASTSCLLCLSFVAFHQV